MNRMLQFKLRDMIHPQVTRTAGFTPEQIIIIETELQAKNLPPTPSETQITQIAQLIQQKYFPDSPSDVALYLRQKLQSAVKMQTPLPSGNGSSMFRQFAESKLQQSKEYVCRSKRKVKPSLPFEYRSLEETVQAMDSNTGQCHSQFERRGRKGVVAGPMLSDNCSWAYHQLFYSSLDKQYLQQDEPFVKLLGELEMSTQKVTYLQHRMIRRAIPKPRVFTPEFVDQQIFRLNQMREQLRASPRQRGKDVQLGVGKEVLALHPICGHLHTGSILAIYKENKFMVKFHRPELGTQKVLDILMTAKEHTSPHKIIVQNMDFEVMALTIRLLQLKTDLVKLMQHYNEKAKEVQEQKGSLDNLFFQEYGWIGSTINILSLGIRHVISKFRLRGLTPNNQERVGRHFSNILINPLTLMEKELEKSSEPSDQLASRQIKNIRGKSDKPDNRTEDLQKELSHMLAEGMAMSGLDQQRRDTMEKLMKSIIGILVSLKCESRGFSIEDNKCVSDLMGLIDRDYSEHFNEIYETLHSITTKVAK